MNAVAQTLASLKLGDAIQHHNLAVFPLFAAHEAVADYLTLDEALETGVARVTEVSEAGHVPELLFVNDAQQSVLLVDGEELVGARQNRILNLTLLVGAKTRVVIPVSCVEQGRWSYRSREFSSAKRNLHARARADKMRDVSRTMEDSGSRMGDQGRVWNHISRKQHAMNVDSPTSAMGDIYEQRRVDVDKYRTAFEAKPGQVGGVFAINGSIRGVELFDSAATFAKFMQKVLGSYALDAAEESTSTAVPITPTAAARDFLSRLQHAQPRPFDALALGEDVRLELGDVSGGALVVGEKVVHLVAFAVDAQPEEEGGRRRGNGG
ncbi:MAG: DUF6569 family protein [Betaproteobacteria bacterium]